MVRKIPPFHSEQRKRSTSEGTPQFLNGISGKNSLPFDKIYGFFRPNGKHPVALKTFFSSGVQIPVPD